jgi:hypothetical protein
MNELEQLCLDKADELATVAEGFVKQFNDDSELKLIGPLRLLLAEYKTNRTLLEYLTKTLSLSPEPKKPGANA